MNRNTFCLDTILNEAKAKYDEILNFNETCSITNKEPICGIYALFFNIDAIDTIIPLYIGQSKNIKNRFISHKTALNKLFKMTNLEFEEHIKSGKQDGNHLYTKIVLFLKNKNLTVKDLKIKVLADNLERTYFRLQKEQALINYYHVETFGFNQLEFIQLANRHSNTRTINYNLTSLSKMWNCGINYIDQFNSELLNYGFYQFNLDSFINWAHIQIQRVENQHISEELKYPTKVINQAIFQEFKEKFMLLAKEMKINLDVW